MAYEYVKVGGTGNLVLAEMGTEDYDPQIGTEVNQAIRNLPMVKKHCDDMAQLLMVAANAGGEFGSAPRFEVVKAGGESRYRAYVAPANSDGITAELNESVLLKAALGMQGR